MSETRAREDSLAVANRYLAALNARNNAGIDDPLRAAAARGCRVQVGTDMLFEQIPAYLEFFGFPGTTPENLRSVATLSY